MRDVLCQQEGYVGDPTKNGEGVNLNPCFSRAIGYEAHLRIINVFPIPISHLSVPLNTFTYVSDDNVAFDTLRTKLNVASTYRGTKAGM